MNKSIKLMFFTLTLTTLFSSTQCNWKIAGAGLSIASIALGLKGYLYHTLFNAKQKVFNAGQDHGNNLGELEKNVNEGRSLDSSFIEKTEASTQRYADTYKDTPRYKYFKNMS